MIPRRVLVQGFLCYRDEQEIGFDGGSLWMLSGPNGSGKSTVFDAVTYALFGQHRGGRQNAKELINRDSEGLVVEFDFLLDGQLYQARRTLKKKSNRSSRQVFHWKSADGVGADEKTWQAVPDTNQEAGFSAWVRDHIGLTYETFTSSVLLLQGKADKLLAAEPAERFKVLAGIVDLGRFQRLFERADEHRREWEAAAKQLERQLGDTGEVRPEEWEESARQIAAAQKDFDEAGAEIERLRRLEIQAERWEGLQNQLAGVREHAERTELLLQQAREIEAADQRLRELRLVLPHVESAVLHRDRLAEALEHFRVLRTEQGSLTAQSEALGRSWASDERRRQKLDQAVRRAETREQDLGREIQLLAGCLSRLTTWEEQQREQSRVDGELARLPADLDERMASVQEDHDRLAALSQNLPHLRRLNQRRQELIQAAERSRATADGESATRNELAVAERELAERTGDLERAVEALQQARDRYAEMRTHLQEARDQVRELEELEGAQRCRHCGQELSPAHYELESVRRERDRQKAEAGCRQAEDAGRVVAAAEKQAGAKMKQVEARLEALREQTRQSRHQREQADRDRLHCLRDCEQCYKDLAPAFQARVHIGPSADWSVTVYPTADDLAEADQLLRTREGVCRQLQELKSQHQLRQELKTRLEATRQMLRVLEADLPEDPAGLRDRQRALQDEFRGLRERLEQNRAALADAQRRLEATARGREGLAGQLAALDCQLAEQAILQQNSRENLERSLSFLADPWRCRAETATADQLEGWRVERASLEESGVEIRLGELQQARAEAEALRRKAADLEAELASFPVEAQVSSQKVWEALQTAKDRLAEREGALRRARQTEHALQTRREQRDKLANQFKEADRRQTLFRNLVEKLGRKGLQLHLVRQAEQGIVDFANAILDRLSGGRFCLRLQKAEEGETEQALQLEAFDRHRGQAFALPFLSGSQRFRVAVSLALALGQYASRQQRPIESVIIDEGFGCLDREGRQVMIQELQNLRSQLRCILLVSHQEEFAEAFADGYRFEFAGGTAAVTRLQK